MIYKFCSPTAQSLENLRNGALYFRHFREFNDPFEFWSRIEEGMPSKAENSRLQAALATW